MFFTEEGIIFSQSVPPTSRRLMELFLFLQGGCRRYKRVETHFKTEVGCQSRFFSCQFSLCSFTKWLSIQCVAGVAQLSHQTVDKACPRLLSRKLVNWFFKNVFFNSSSLIWEYLVGYIISENSLGDKYFNNNSSCGVFQRESFCSLCNIVNSGQNVLSPFF